MALELPGFSTPDAPKAQARAVSPLGQTLRLRVADNMPLARPMPVYEVRIEKALGNQVDVMALADNAQIVTQEGTATGTKSHWLVIFPDELEILHGAYQIRVLTNGTEIFRKSVNVGQDRE